MLNTILLLSALQFGEMKGCSDSLIELLEVFETKVEYLQPTTRIFEPGSLKIKASMPPACSVVNTESIVEFDIDGHGKITNYKVLMSNPKRIHDRAIKKALFNAATSKSSHSSINNRVRVVYQMYETKT